MEFLANEQTLLGKEIEKLIRSYHDQSPDKKTIAYLEEKLTLVENLWMKFENNDDRIRDIAGVSLDHPYFIKDYHRTVKIAVEKFKAEVQSLIEYVKTQSFEERQTTSNIGQQSVDKVAMKIGNTDLARLLKKHKAMVATLKHLISNTTVADDQSTEYLKLKKERLEKMWIDIEQNHYTIWETAEDVESSGYDSNEFFVLQNQSEKLLIDINSCLAKPDDSVNLAHSQNESQLKLPKIELPKFDGEYVKWPQFADLFTQMVHDQPIGNCQKLWYLKMNLSGEAARLVMHLPISNSNYIIAWDMLQNRYANKRLLVNALLDKLMAQPDINTESATALKTLHDTTKECLFTLQTIGISAKEHWDPIIVHTILKKLDRTSYTLYEQTLKAPRDLPSLDELLRFIEMRFQTLETLNQKTGSSKHPNKPIKQSSLVGNNIGPECKLCKKAHAIYHCDSFLKLSPEKRLEKAKQMDLCTNCLKKGHLNKKCTSRGCQKCNKRHNTLLHYQGSKVTSTEAQNTNLAAQFSEANGYVFLGTALAKVISREGKPIQARALLDSGSQLNFITEKLRKKLGFRTIDPKINISGIGNTQVKASERINITMKSICRDFTTPLEVYAIKEITNNQPQYYIDTDDWNIPENIALADPMFNKPGKIDILLGAEVYSEIMRNGQIRLLDQLPILQNTTLGWVVLGKASNCTSFCGISNVNLERQLEKFWELEDCSGPVILSAIDKKCEEYFEATTSRNSNGRFIVNLPLLGDSSLLGESKSLAYKRLLSMERTLSKQPSLKRQYDQFLLEYLDLGHMKEVPTADCNEPHYFMPHHYVLKPDSSTTKLRVVFDASAKTKNNLSLNDLLLKGPKVQEDVSAIITRFRLKRYVFTADIRKMYRQIFVSEEDQNLQLIMWRKNVNDEIKYYKLATVTYGTKSAPYLAIKCLKKLAEEGSNQYPLGAAAIQDFYVDDVLTGSDDLEQALTIRNELRPLLASAGFDLHKWCANHPKLIQGITNQDLDIELDFTKMDSDAIKTLGIIWQPVTDMLTITTVLKEHQRVSKRNILADISQIFDPLGLVSPVIVKGKLLMQELWRSQVGWDDEIPDKLQSIWYKYRDELPDLNKISIPRYMFSDKETLDTQIHAFADASEKAYGTAVYIRSKDKRGHVTVKLLCAKSKVAPIKPTTIPRLELCAAKLAAQLVRQIQLSTNLKANAVFYWSDSLIVISWIRGDPSIRKTFVANRVAAIQDLTSTKDWRYVPTMYNPADLVSRGLFPEELRQARLWFHGPIFLRLPKTSWPVEPHTSNIVDEETKVTKFAAPDTFEAVVHPLYIIEHGNSFRKLIRSMAYINRAVKLFKNKTSKLDMKLLSPGELEDALVMLVKEVQRSSFSEEITLLKKNEEVAKSSKLRTLTPFLAPDGTIRVGGRLQAAEVSYDTKHPIALPGDHFFTRLLLTNLHRENLHAGPQALNAIARQRYWILNGRNLSRTVVTNCILCSKFRPRLLTQQMGNLPKDRVRLTRPFINCGVDFCGPVYTHFKIRGKRPQKTYLAVFCCFATKAIHLEVVSDLTTDGFLGALKRFESRRGKCEHIYCDNARNFVGANNQLKELESVLTDQRSTEKIVNTCSTTNTQFHFIPPRSPHFGGLWEAAVKSTKYLLQRTVASASLTYEELCTVAAEVEALLNSRPLTPLSSDPNDLAPLTPAHFLIGEPLAGATTASNETTKMSLACRWQLTSQLKNEFWRRWYIEYLGELQKRTKWTAKQNNIKLGTLVTIKEDNLPPFKWKLGRIIETIQGPDGRVRVADVQTSTGIIRRAIHKLAPLPIDPDVTVETVAESMTVATASEERARKRKGSPSRWSSLKTCLLTLLVLPLATFHNTSADKPSIEIIEVDNNGGVFFETIGNGRISPSSWTLIVFYDLKGYWETFKTIEAGIKQLERLKDTITNNTYHEAIVMQCHHLLHLLNQDNDILQETTKLRQKRSPFDIVGSIANKLFGVLDNEYAATMSETISKIATNENNLNELVKKHTSILDTTINIITKSESERVNQTKQIQKAFAFIYDNMKFFNSEIKQQKTIEAFNTLSVFVMSLITECQEMQHSLIEVMIDAHHECVNPNVISPHQIKSQIAYIKDNLPQDLELPGFGNPIRVSRIYQLLKLQYANERDCLVFALTLPLLLTTRFHILHALPLPTMINNTFLSLSSAPEFMMVNVFKDQFYPLATTELMQCQTSELNCFICSGHRPIMHKSDRNGDCIVELLSKNRLAPSCVFIHDPRRKFWQQLNSPNQWLFSLDKPYDFTFVCNNQVFQQTLQRKGILKMQPGCTLKDDELSFRAFNNQQTSVNVSVFPAINISITDLAEFSETSRSFNHPWISQTTVDIKGLNRTLNELSIKQAELQHLEIQSTHTISASYLALGIILIAVCWHLYRRLRPARRANVVQKPVPAPRTSFHDQQYSFEV